MKIFCTFNDKIYHSSGKDLIFSLKENGVSRDFSAYYEFEDLENQKTIKKLAPKSKDITSDKSGDLIQNIFSKNRDIISPKYGGNASKKISEDFWNNRWFGWFKKIAMAYDAIYYNKDQDLILFLDSDIRAIKPFQPNEITNLMGETHIGILKGDREAVEAGVIAVKPKNMESWGFYRTLANSFETGEFKKFKRWDDGYVFAKLMEVEGACKFHDFAANQKQGKFTNSNGHTTNNQILPFSEIGHIFEHDKGKHVREKIV